MMSSFVRALVSAFKARRELAIENVALRQQLAVLRRSVKRPRLSNVDREFWVLLRVLPPLSVSSAPAPAAARTICRIPSIDIVAFSAETHDDPVLAFVLDLADRSVGAREVLLPVLCQNSALLK